MNKPLQALILIAAFRLIASGTDLIAGDPIPQTPTEAAGLTSLVWGVAALVTGVVLTLSIVFQSSKAAVIGSTFAFAVYFMFGVAVIDDTVFNIPPDDWRVLVDFWASSAEMAVIAFAISFRSGVEEILAQRRAVNGVG